MDRLFIFMLVLCKTSLICSSPNFLIFLADDLGYGDIGCFGNHSIKTPNIDRLCSNGVKLSHHLTAAAVCTPSRAAIMTGRYPIRSGMESSNRNKVFFFVAASGGLPENETTVAKALKKRDYSTALIGKWHLGNDQNTKGDGLHHPLKHGFDYFYGTPLTNLKDFGSDGDSVITTYIPNFFLYMNAVPVIGLTLAFFIGKRYWNLIFILFAVIIPIGVNLFLRNLNVINGVVMENMEVVEQPLRLQGMTQRFVSKANEFLDKQQGPFLLYMSFMHVHTALFCSKDFKGKSAHGSYGDNVQEMDWAIGKIMEKLEALGLRNNTFVYFSSDNGAHIEEVGIKGQREGGYNGNLRGGKTMGGMEGGIRVPSIISWAGASVSGEIKQPTSQMDLFPTVLELAQVPLPKDRIIDGKSLVPLLKGESKAQHQFLFHYCGKLIHAATYIQHDKQKIWKIHWTTPKFLPGTSQCEYVCHCFGDFVVHHNPPLLYDLTNDPSESVVIDQKSNPDYFDILKRVERARDNHRSKVDHVPDQFSFFNTVWKPWLQPCCNFPYCNCRDSNFMSQEL
ncbi:hypothetical protein JTE90_015242 [Oedothorax gibbosus]|uniref:Sulfatase N-terminal domain-containing protein n=1 Tax=Oedothorax gibbosus TaxID=931172 RepID=A0AAV6TYZ5_9ARAC|nr:hypothetical protein JTE90_015242 [Oedothorax gibbosus]